MSLRFVEAFQSPGAQSGRRLIAVECASSGIGARAAIEFARHGCKLSLGGRNKDNLEIVRSKCHEVLPSSFEILTSVGDITKDTDRKSLVERTVETFGQIDVLINNAGRGAGHTSELFSQVEAETLDVMFSINVFSHVLVTKLAIPHLIKTKGCVVNISSVWSTVPAVGAGVCCMTKASVDMFTKVLAAEMAQYGVRVNSINPGSVPTNLTRGRNGPTTTSPGDEPDISELNQKYSEYSLPMHPLGRLGSVYDVSHALLFLSSENSSFITGQHLYVDGGRSLRGEYLAYV
ncbi:3-oxoacyl-[acyl-carrier-protein] reductase FabG-like [Gigantopelta aegis]|uniref:3-oxoacyl-[acyl-carrier-protein] reductase FabG-like n=1 Tax=Gigantopelta aegis TaxID=1735272 RepID=UPI001B88B1CA|nr:3-oxoacyl-[acyl-carrier-protein] reductase FabG-like [Gigantopelta aegis]